VGELQRRVVVNTDDQVDVDHWGHAGPVPSPVPPSLVVAEGLNGRATL
jgi:hypothetical protein